MIRKKSAKYALINYVDALGASHPVEKNLSISPRGVGCADR